VQVVRRIMLGAALLVLGAYGVASAAGGGGPTPTSKPVTTTTSTSTPSDNGGPGGGNGQGSGGHGTPGDNGGGCQPINTKRGSNEQAAIDDPTCPGYNGNAENTFIISSTTLQRNVTFTATGGWCATGSTVTFKWDPGSIGGTSYTIGSAPVQLNRQFTNAPITITSSVPTSANGAGNVVAICSTGTRYAAATLA
jgi:hypothetical protein